MIEAALIVLLGCALFAYVPLVLVVRHARSPRDPGDELLRRYVQDDEISTAEYLAELERHWSGVEHAPLKAGTGRR